MYVVALHGALRSSARKLAQPLVSVPSLSGVNQAPSLVEPIKSYVMKPGDSHLYDVGAVHSPKRDSLTKLVRIEGKNLDRAKRSNIKAA